MSTSTDWNFDPRSHAQTRAVLMALSRDRSWYFVASLPIVLVKAAITFGIWPLLDIARRFDRWRRLEWNQYAELADWIAHRTQHEDAAILRDNARQHAGPPGSRWDVRLLAVGAVGILAWTIFGERGPAALLTTAFFPASMSPAAIAYSAVLSLAWTAHLVRLVRHQAAITDWLIACNELLRARDMRPIAPPVAGLPLGWILLGLLIGVAGPTWAGLLVVVIALQNRYMDSARAARLQFIERMLEWMDNSGLPVEYDVEELEPEEIARALA